MFQAFIGQALDTSDPDVKTSDMQAALTAKQDAAAFLTTLVGIGGTSGTGNLARVTSPTFTTPNIGAATATTIAASGAITCANMTASGTLNVTGASIFATNLTVSSGVLAGQNVQSAAGGYIYWLGRTSMMSKTNGTLYVTNQAETSGVTLDVATDGTLKIRDRTNTADAAITAGNITASGTVTASGTGTHTFGTTNTVTMAAGVLTASSKLVSGAGTLAAPSITVGDSATGLFKVATNQVGFSVNGSELVRFATGNIFYSFGVFAPYEHIQFSVAGKGIAFKSGAGAKTGNATLVAGTVTVTNTTVTANTIIQLTVKTTGGTLGALSYTLSAGASFTINSSSASDTSTVSYLLVELTP